MDINTIIDVNRTIDINTIIDMTRIIDMNAIIYININKCKHCSVEKKAILFYKIQRFMRTELITSLS